MMKTMANKKYNQEYYRKNKDILTIHNKEYSENNKKSISENKKKYYQENKELIALKRKEYYEKNKDKIRAQRKKYKDNNKDKIARQYANQQRKRLSTPTGKLKHNIRAAIRRSLIESGYTKKYTSETILGCNIVEFKIYLEGLFKPWMNWENKGLYNGNPNYGWDLDHIIPLSTAETEEDVIKLNHYSNIQPLCSHHNRDIKRNTIK